jgi:hypothetical protein
MTPDVYSGTYYSLSERAMMSGPIKVPSKRSLSRGSFAPATSVSATASGGAARVSRPSLRGRCPCSNPSHFLITTRSSWTVATYLAQLVHPSRNSSDSERVSADYFQFRYAAEADAPGSRPDARLRRNGGRSRKVWPRCAPPAGRRRHARMGGRRPPLVTICEATHNVVILFVMPSLPDLLNSGVFLDRDRDFPDVGCAKAPDAKTMAQGRGCWAGSRQADSRKECQDRPKQRGVDAAQCAWTRR